MSTKHLIFTPLDRTMPGGPIPDGTEVPIMGAVAVPECFRPSLAFVARANEVGLDVLTSDMPELPEHILEQGAMFLERLQSAVNN